MKPKIFYIDDEPNNLTVFEASVPSEWEVFIFDKPMEALSAVSKEMPCVIVSDQRMPGVNGVDFLDLTKKIHPNAVRIIVTGYSDENLVVESVRKAQVFDYIRKPWDADELEQSLRRAIDFYNLNEEGRLLQETLKKREAELQKQTIDLLKLTADLESSNKREQEIRKELECWVPPFVLWTLNDNTIRYPLKKDIVGITFDIINSSKIHDKLIKGIQLRSVVINNFSEAVIKHGGWRESHSGDSAYGHFGLIEDETNPYESALAAAREFRVSLRNISKINDFEIECGIALHIAKNSMIDVHTVQLKTPRGIITQKSFDTSSIDIDLLHRMEKIVHQLPGSNIVMSEDFLKGLKEKPFNLIEIGTHLFKGQVNPVHLYIIPSELVKEEMINDIKSIQKSA